MQHVAIDLGSRKSQVCIRNSDGNVTREWSIRTVDIGGMLAKLPRSRVVMETCSESFRIAEDALAVGHEVRVVPATLVRQLGVGRRGIKTDKRDAQALSEASCRIDLPSVHIRSAIARERLTRVGMRHALVTARTQLVNAVRGWLRTRLIHVRGTSEGFPENVREALLAMVEGMPLYVEDLLQAIEKLNKQIERASTEIRALADGDPVCSRLMTVPGVGPITATTFVGVVDQVERFAKAEVLESYLGLTPGENSSSKRVQRTGITKAGPALLRHALTQASLSLRRVRPTDPAVRWSERVKARRGKQIATVALARKLAGILYAMWRDGTSYEPQRAAKPEPAGLTQDATASELEKREAAA